MVYCFDTSQTAIRSASIIMYIISLIFTLFLISYIGRYLSGLQHPQLTSELVKIFYASIGYSMTIIQWVFIAIIYICIFADASNNDSNNISYVFIDACSPAIIALSISSMIIWYSTVVFKPMIPGFCNTCNIKSDKLYLNNDVTDEKIIEYQQHSKIKLFLQSHGLYHEDRASLNAYLDNPIIVSSSSLTAAFIMSLFMMNCSFALYYNRQVYHDVLIWISVISGIIPCIFQIIIMWFLPFSYYSETCSFIFWLTVLILWGLGGLGSMIGIATTYSQWLNLNSPFKENIKQWFIFLMVQGVPGSLTLVIIMIIGIYHSIPAIKSCFLSCISCSYCKKQIKEATNQVYGHDQLICPTHTVN
ncbi:MAG: hypothetical protein Barrevirus18_12 [Barrevirus sp.]|uniref:Transmembrane protein n=1 Tax=Barrevirus sp. TaxID=2487763 RepID=A0A3G4ZQL9_9VIRU|nr:MAG: hypothetical protein Barrevirus18_12 [Barrevirus sp.]